MKIVDFLRRGDTVGLTIKIEKIIQENTLPITNANFSYWKTFCSSDICASTMKWTYISPMRMYLNMNIFPSHRNWRLPNYNFSLTTVRYADIRWTGGLWACKERAYDVQISVGVRRVYMHARVHMWEQAELVCSRACTSTENGEKDGFKGGVFHSVSDGTCNVEGARKTRAHVSSPDSRACIFQNRSEYRVLAREFQSHGRFAVCWWNFHSNSLKPWSRHVFTCYATTFLLFRLKIYTSRSDFSSERHFSFFFLFFFFSFFFFCRSVTARLTGICLSIWLVKFN